MSETVPNGNTSPLDSELDISPELPDREPAHVTRTPDGLSTVALVLHGDDLRALGLPRDAKAVVPRVESGVVLVEPVK